MTVLDENSSLHCKEYVIHAYRSSHCCSEIEIRIKNYGEGKPGNDNFVSIKFTDQGGFNYAVKAEPASYAIKYHGEEIMEMENPESLTLMFNGDDEMHAALEYFTFISDNLKKLLVR